MPSTDTFRRGDVIAVSGTPSYGMTTEHRTVGSVERRAGGTSLHLKATPRLRGRDLFVPSGCRLVLVERVETQV